MDFVSYIMSFYDYVNDNRLSQGQIALFIAIAAQCFDRGGTSIIIKNQEKLQSMAGNITYEGLRYNLNILKQKGLIDFKKGDKWKGKEYRLLFNTEGYTDDSDVARGHLISAGTTVSPHQSLRDSFPSRGSLWLKQQDIHIRS